VKFTINLKMNMRYLIISVLTFVATIVVYNIRVSESLKNDKLSNFPFKIGEWVAKDIPMDDWVYESLETRYAIQRIYTSPLNEQINFVIVWYDDKEIAFHSASACLGSSGDKVREDTFHEVKMDDGNVYKISKLVTDKYNKRTIVLYYYLTDGAVAESQTQVRKKVILKRLQFKRTSAAFIRIMMTVNDNEDQTLDTLERFFKLTLPASIEYTNTPLSAKDQMDVKNLKIENPDNRVTPIK
jgi:EpsI family protein